MTKDSFLNYFDFKDEKEKENAVFYIDMKGIAVHMKIAKHLGVDFDNAIQRTEWDKVASILRYDKKLRDKIYIYLATLEEYMRAFISNKYEEIPNQDFWIDGYKKPNKIKSRINKGESVSEVLEDVEFGALIEQVEYLPLDDQSGMFCGVLELSKNLDAVRELRNAISHHKFLREYKFLGCIVDGEKDNTLEHNIKNLRQLLPKEYRYGKNEKGGITTEINNCRFDIEYDENKRQTKKEMNVDIRDLVFI